MKTLRVLHVGKFYPPHRGGIETHVRDLAVRQAKTAHVTVIVSSSSRRGSREVMDGVSVIRVARLGTIASMPVCPGLVAAIRTCPADLVHLHTPNPGALAALILSGYTGKIVITHHADTLGRRALRAVVHPFVRAVMKRASAIIATSWGYLESSEELKPYREKCRVIPLGIDLSNTGEPDVAVAKTLDFPQLLAVGRLVPYKGFDVLIRAMSRIDAKLLLIGSGPEEAKLQKLIEAYGVREKTELVGHVEDLRPYLRNASAFILPSITRAEAFGLVQLEAMAAGVPVINTRLNSGVPEVSIDGETGITVEPGDAEGLAGAIQFLLVNEQVRNKWGAAAMRRVRTEFTADLMAQRTLALYRSVLGQI